MSDWRPLSRRNAIDKPEGLYEGVPPHLLAHLTDWVADVISGSYSGHLRWISLQLRIPLNVRDYGGAYGEFLGRVKNDPTLLLDSLDAILWFNAKVEFREQPARSLEIILRLGGSAWRVSSDGSALERRIDESVSQRAKELMQESSSAAEHLRSAWSACYGRNPDPSKSYSEAIKAVEAAAIPVVSPKDTTATLGKVIGTMKKNPEQFQTAIDNGVESVVGLMGLLWHQQSDRHAGVGETPKISQGEAEMALHAAFTLVYWFTSGMIRCA